VLETAILATRTHLLPATQIREEMAKLQIIVDKTAGPREHEAMQLLRDHLQHVLAPPKSPASPAG
jgi:hypothetical protein